MRYLMCWRNKRARSLALSVDQTNLNLDTDGKVTALGGSFEAARLSSHCEKIIRWLNVFDSASNHADARNDHEAMTGEWFIRGTAYTEWKSTPGSFLWLHGISRLRLDWYLANSLIAHLT